MRVGKENVEDVWEKIDMLPLKSSYQMSKTRELQRSWGFTGVTCKRKAW